MNNYGLLKSEDRITTMCVINELGFIPLNYNGDMVKFDIMINNIIKKYPKYISVINSDFLKNKKKYFINGALNYSIIPVYARSNSYLESYDEIKKSILLNKHNLSWLTFINFIIDEIKYNNKKMKELENSNVLYAGKKSKFGIKKYNPNLNIKEQIQKKEDVCNINTDLEMHEYNDIQNLQWLKNFGNLCRYDNFLTIFFGSIYNNIKIVKDLYNDFICQTCYTIEDIIKNRKYKAIEKLWKFFIAKRLDYNMVFAPENKSSFNDNGFGVSGCVYQIFKMFENEYDFCLKEKRRHECFNCNSVYYDQEQFRLVFI